MLEELDELFKSSTIQPTFDYVHIILALIIFGKHPEGIGRYRLKENLLIGSGTARSLINKLNEVSNYIKVPEDNKRRGHILTDKGLKFLNSIKKRIAFLEKGDIKFLKEIIIHEKKINAYVALVKQSSNKIISGIEQRDAAIKVNGSGATCLLYDGENLKYPSSSMAESDEVKLNDDLKNYFKLKANKYNAELEKGDVIIVGLGNSPEKARLATLNSALTLID